MKLIDFSYLINLLLDSKDELAEAAVNHLKLGDYLTVKTGLLGLYNSLPAAMKKFVRSAENPKLKQNFTQFAKLQAVIDLESYT